MTAEDWVKIAEDWLKHQEQTSTISVVGGFVLRGTYIAEWLENVNTSVTYRGVKFFWKYPDHTKAVFRDRIGIDFQWIGQIKEQLEWFFSFIFQMSTYYKNGQGETLRSALLKDSVFAKHLLRRL